MLKTVLPLGRVLILSAVVAASTASGSIAQVAHRESNPAPTKPLALLKADCQLVIDNLAGRYNPDKRRVYLDFTVRNVGTTTCFGVDTTFVSFSWVVHTFYLKDLPGGGQAVLAPMDYDDAVDHFPAQGKAFGNIAPGGTKTLSITPAAGYSVNGQYHFVKADIYVANMIAQYSNNGVVGYSPYVTKGMIVTP